jgi:probable phosphoglycerate mutase
MTAARVLLVRHGRTAYNAQDRFQGQTDIPLDEVGLSEAKRAAEALALLVDGDRVRIVSSDLQRAQQTAETIADRLGAAVSLDTRLREIFAGTWEGLLRDDIIADWPDDFAAWRRGDPNVRIGGGESRAQAGARAAEAITQLEQELDGGTLICVSHGGALRAAILLLIGTPNWPWHALSGLSNAHWAELRHTDRGWRLSSYNVG